LLEPQGGTIDDREGYIIDYGTVGREMLQGGDEGNGAQRFCPGTPLAPCLMAASTRKISAQLTFC
jgi:hypothetical protein